MRGTRQRTPTLQKAKANGDHSQVLRVEMLFLVHRSMQVLVGRD